ncbi:VanW family protein [Falsibacillus pallidus]|uniref:VanW like protein n=1 Tax=Falsibacillus pallidus TaxID=493781 RepID=A0A370GVE9_9BACI|nr:VanW family protein [Falsibacillus pallidus]RDI45893.1 VanW like protein [Falsibacillus pallidus]
MMKMLFTLALTIASAPVNNGEITLLHDGFPISTTTREDFQLAPFDSAVINHDELNLYIHTLEKKVYTPPQNAFIDASGNLVGEHNGHRLDPGKFKKAYFMSYFQKGAKQFEIPLKPVYPKVDSELLSQIKTKVIGRYITYFNPGNAERSNNIQLAAAAINNTVIFPNETFSFNQTVGKRTKDRGYLPVPIIIRGELSEGVGGGICQVSSTLFNAVDKAGVTILERYSHSRKVPYVPPKRDATVSWYGPDFTFKNPHNQPILIRSKVTGGQVVITIYSSEGIKIK